MKPLRTAALCATSIALSAPAGAADLLTTIDDAHRDGLIGRAERLAYRVAAVRAPDRVPIWLRQRATDEPRRARSHTGVMVEAFQALPKVSPAERMTLRDLLAPPPDLSQFVETTSPYPIRVSYESAYLQTKAEQVLAAAITSYQRQVEDWGFWEPPIEAGTELYRFYVMDAGGAAGYTAPYFEVDDTDHYDSYSYIVIDPMMADLSLQATVAHEFNHACQVAMDVGELRAFMENSASYIEAEVFPAAAPMMSAMFPWFQRQPFRALEYTLLFDSDYYEYGGALWALFLTEQYGAGDPSWLRRVWEGSVQSSWQNEPDYFDVLDEMLADDGGLREAVRRFAEHRFFVGRDDDGQHLTGAGLWPDAEVWRTATLAQSQLPVRNAGPTSADTRPEPNGCNYVVLDLDSSSQLPLVTTFDGQDDLLWDVAVIEAGGSVETSATAIELDADARGELRMTPTGAARLVLVICQRASPSYDPDDGDRVAGDYTYGIEHDLPPPTIAAVTPAELEQGTSNVELTVTGTGFMNYPGLQVIISGHDLITTLHEYVSPEELTVQVIVPQTALLGPRDVTVRNPGGGAATGEGLVTIVAPAPEPEAIPSAELVPAGGCTIGQRDRSGSASAWPLLALLGLLARRRARA